MKRSFSLVAILGLCSVASAQTYTYHSYPANQYTSPISQSTIVGNKGYGCTYGGAVYQAQLSGVEPTLARCESNAALTMDSSGNLYGEDKDDNGMPAGRIFRVNTRSNWKEVDLWHFNGLDGSIYEGPYYPGGAPITESPVVVDSSGSILGVTYSGGNSACNNIYNVPGCGVIFELTKEQGETVIHNFTGPPDGANPEGRLTYDAATGSYYGTTQYGGDSVCNCGTVFQLTPNGDGTWSENVIYTFQDGGQPTGGVILDSQGNLYGVNFGKAFDPNNCGYVYDISAGQFSVIYAFEGYPSSANPNGPLVFDSFGNLWGTTNHGGIYGGGYDGWGTIFELSPSPSGWQYTLFHSFEAEPTDGRSPNTGISVDEKGNLWGGMTYGGLGTYGIFYQVALTP